MKFDRAWRRAQNSRLKKKRQNYWWFVNCQSDVKTPRQLGILLATPKPCSCYMCGNPRKYNNEKHINELRME